jgi:hypothetical protein
MIKRARVKARVFVAWQSTRPYSNHLGGRPLAPRGDGVKAMYRFIGIVSGALLLAACSSTGDWFRPVPQLDTIRFESEPPGAEAKTTTGQSCRTPCALAMPETTPFGVTFSLNGYLPDDEQVELVGMGDNTSKLRPNPVVAELTPVPPPQKPKRRPVRRRVAKRKPVPAPAPQSAAPAAPAAPPPMTAAPEQQSPSPWPSAPPPPPPQQ